MHNMQRFKESSIKTIYNCEILFSQRFYKKYVKPKSFGISSHSGKNHSAFQETPSLLHPTRDQRKIAVFFDKKRKLKFQFIYFYYRCIKNNSESKGRFSLC